MSMITPILSKHMKREYIILTGILLVFIANSFMGSARYFGLPTALWCVILGMVFLGISANMVFVVFMPELVHLSMTKIGK